VRLYRECAKIAVFDSCRYGNEDNRGEGADLSPMATPTETFSTRQRVGTPQGMTAFQRQ
jgi:hypothetical protein